MGLSKNRLMLRGKIAVMTFLMAGCLMPVYSALADDDSTYGRYRSVHKKYKYQNHRNAKHKSKVVQLGPRPFYLVDQMEPSRLKWKLKKCESGPFYKSDFSIGHRGAPMQFPEHTKESYVAAARMGAGIMECDVTFTDDGQLVCRHAQCDLHTTTDIVNTPLVSKCSTPPDFGQEKPFENVSCCASDLTLQEFKSLCGKMDASDPSATTVEGYLGGTADWRTDLYSTCGTLLSHKESIDLFKKLRVKMTPELKAGQKEDVDRVFGSQEAYAQAMIDDYKAAGVKPRDVYAQSFNPDDIIYWINNESKFGKQAVYLDDRYDDTNPADPDDPGEKGVGLTLPEIADPVVKIVAPPMWVLLTVKDGKIAPSRYAKKAKAAGLDIITWTIERSGRINEEVLEGRGSNFYYQSTDGSSETQNALSSDGDIMTTIDVLARDVGVLGIFSDWPATTTYYANCLLD